MLCGSKRAAFTRRHAYIATSHVQNLFLMMMSILPPTHMHTLGRCVFIAAATDAMLFDVRLFSAPPLRRCFAGHDAGARYRADEMGDADSGAGATFRMMMTAQR